MSTFHPLQTFKCFNTLFLVGRIAASLRRAFVVAACGCAGAFGLLNPSELIISTVGTTGVTSLSVISTEGHLWPLGDLPPGRTVHFSESLSGEGALQVEFTTGGKRVKSSGGCYYTSGGLNPAYATVTIRGPKVRVDCRSG